MKKIIIATHHELAKGFKDTLEYLIPNTVEIYDINAYMDNTSVNEQIDNVLKKFNKEEQIFVFTDIAAGSVNQEFTKKICEYNIHLISGVNLLIIMSIALSLNEGVINSETIREEIKNAANSIVYVNDLIKNIKLEEDDE